jgi:hypothetical protein
VFRIVWPIIAEGEDDDGKRGDKKKSARKRSDLKEEKNASSMSKVAIAVGGTALGALTTGMGVLGGMMLAGSAVNTNEKTTAQRNEKREKNLTLACDSFADAEKWVGSIQAELRRIGGCGDLLSSDILTADSAPPLEMRLEEVEDWIRSSRWTVRKITHGLRIFELIDQDATAIDSIKVPGGGASSSSRKSALPCMRVTIPMNGAPTEVFSTLMNMPPACRTGVIKSYRLVETLSQFVDVIHVTLDMVYMFPTNTAPRDLCLLRYWKQNSDGSFVICLDSTEHADCPLVPGYVRAQLHGAYTVSGPKECGADTQDNVVVDDCESLVSFIAQYDPLGWIWEQGGYRLAVTQMLMLHVLDVRDTIDTDRFMQVQFDAALERNISKNPSANLPRSGGVTESAQGTIGTIPAPTCPANMWADVDPSTFRVRGRSYNTDKVKEASGPNVFKLICVDMFEVVDPVRNIAADPKNRVYLANQRGDNTWVFVVSFMVPGPPNLNFVVYLEGNKEVIEADTPFGRIARPFFFGNDDEFRNNRFKLIPKIVEGNMVVKMAVKDTPTLIGNKLKQYYFKGDNYFELDIDVGSSNIAK